MTEYNPAFSLSSGRRWEKCRATFAVEFRSFVRFSSAKESKIAYLAAKPHLLQKCKLFINLEWKEQTNNLGHSVVNIVLSNTSGIWDNNRSPQFKFFTSLLYTTVCYSFMSAVRTTAWLTVGLLDGKHTTVFDNDIDKGVKPTEDVLFQRFKYFFHLMIAWKYSALFTL